MANFEFYPKPINYYQSPNFVGHRSMLREPCLDTDPVRFYNADINKRARILAQLKVNRFGRSGRLNGEYALIADHGVPVCMVDKSGVPIKVGFDGDDDWAHVSNATRIERYCVSTEFVQLRDFLLSNWERVPQSNCQTVLIAPFAEKNYYHFVRDLLPKIRAMPDDDKLLIGLPAAYLKQIFQRELVSLCIGSRRFMSFTGCVRINNPTFNHEPFAELDLNWLLGQTKIRARRGSRRIYITRGKSINRKIIEDENFQKFLSQNRFETIDFGNGETSIFQQIKMLDGAGIVLSPHGANLTNIAFLEAGVSVIEVLPAPWSYASFIEIGLMARLNYACVVNNAISNKQGDMIADIDYLVQALGEALKHG